MCAISDDAFAMEFAPCVQCTRLRAVGCFWKFDICSPFQFDFHGTIYTKKSVKKIIGVCFSTRREKKIMHINSISFSYQIKSKYNELLVAFDICISDDALTDFDFCNTLPFDTFARVHRITVQAQKSTFRAL